MEFAVAPRRVSGRGLKYTASCPAGVQAPRIQEGELEGKAGPAWPAELGIARYGRRVSLHRVTEGAYMGDAPSCRFEEDDRR
jgi:hypothetical protein